MEVIKMADPTKVEFFPLAMSASCCEPSGGSSCCGPCDPTIGNLTEGKDPNEVLLQRAKEIEGVFGENVNVEIANYSTTADIFKAIDRFNNVLSNSGKKFFVTPGNFYTFVASVTPMITINGKIVFTKTIPTKEELIGKITEHSKG